jgi:DNA polymerase-4
MKSTLLLNISSFAVSVERALHPRLLSGRPLAIALPTSRSVLLDLSSEARLAGLHRGMPLFLAEKLCPDLRVLPPRPDLYDRATAALARALQQFSPLCEAAGPGHFFLDLTGTQRLWGPPADAAARIRDAVGRELRLWPAAGAAANKLVSHVATRVVKPDGVEAVEPGTEAAYLAPLGVHLLPGLGDETLRRLEELNVRRAGELAATPAPALAAVFGAAGPPLRDRARGVDPTPVCPDAGAREIAERITLADDTNDADTLADHASRLAQAAARRLRAEGIRARRAAVALTHSDGLRSSRQRLLPAPADLDPDLLPHVLDLLAQALQRRVRVRSLAVSFARLGPADVQPGLFGEGPEAKRKLALTAAVDRVRAKFGAGALTYRRLG